MKLVEAERHRAVAGVVERFHPTGVEVDAGHLVPDVNVDRVLAELLRRPHDQVVEIVDHAAHDVRDAAGRVAGVRAALQGDDLELGVAGGPAQQPTCRPRSPRTSSRRAMAQPPIHRAGSAKARSGRAPSPPRRRGHPGGGQCRHGRRARPRTPRPSPAPLGSRPDGVGAAEIHHDGAHPAGDPLDQRSRRTDERHVEAGLAGGAPRRSIRSMAYTTIVRSSPPLRRRRVSTTWALAAPTRCRARPARDRRRRTRPAPGRRHRQGRPLRRRSRTTDARALQHLGQVAHGLPHQMQGLVLLVHVGVEQACTAGPHPPGP